jgi:hypothetical protein
MWLFVCIRHCWLAPGAFRDWGVELWDWQSQCSSTTEVDADGRRKLRYLSWQQLLLQQQHLLWISAGELLKGPQWSNCWICNGVFG